MSMIFSYNGGMLDSTSSFYLLEGYYFFKFPPPYLLNIYCFKTSFSFSI